MRSFEDDLHTYIAHNHPQVFARIADTGLLEDDTVATLERCVDDVKKQFELISDPGAPRSEGSSQSGASSAGSDGSGSDSTGDGSAPAEASDSAGSSESSDGAGSAAPAQSTAG